MPWNTPLRLSGETHTLSIQYLALTPGTLPLRSLDYWFLLVTQTAVSLILSVPPFDMGRGPGQKNQNTIPSQVHSLTDQFLMPLIRNLLRTTAIPKYVISDTRPVLAVTYFRACTALP